MKGKAETAPVNPAVAVRPETYDDPAQAALRAELKRCGLKVCYQSCRSGNNELYVIDADGENDRNITHTPDIRESYPHVSPDGRRVCFRTLHAQDPDYRFDIYWMNIDGSNRTLVAHDATDPCWDPDGTRIMFVKRLPDSKTVDYRNTGLYVYDIRTGQTEEITNGKLYHAYVPCWSPAGDWAIATVHEHAEFGHAIVAIDLKTGRISSFEKTGVNGCRPDFSWDGRMFCWNPDDEHIRVTPFSPASIHCRCAHPEARWPTPWSAACALSPTADG